MNIILRPVDPAKRLPDMGDYDTRRLPHKTTKNIFVALTDESTGENGRTFAYYNFSTKKWGDSIPGQNLLDRPDIKLIAWYEEIPIESLFPGDELAYNVASASGNGSIYKIGIHQEG